MTFWPMARRVLAAISVVGICAIAVKKGWLTDSVKLNDAITQVAIAALGIFTAWMIGHGNVPPPPVVPKEPPASPEDEDATEAAVSPLQQVPVALYNDAVRRHNSLVYRLREAKQLKNAFAKYAGEEQLRSARLRLNSRAFRVALTLAAVTSFIAFLFPIAPANSGTTAARFSAGYVQLGLTLIAAVAISAGLTRDIMSETPYQAHIVAFWIGCIGTFSCGFISLAMSLPYRWADLSKMPSPVAGLNLGFFIIAVRLIIIPVTGYLGSLAIAARTPKKRASAPTSARD
jgi:hypothetical protein